MNKTFGEVSVTSAHTHTQTHTRAKNSSNFKEIPWTLTIMNYIDETFTQFFAPFLIIFSLDFCCCFIVFFVLFCFLVVFSNNIVFQLSNVYIYYIYMNMKSKFTALKSEECVTSYCSFQRWNSVKDVVNIKNVTSFICSVKCVAKQPLFKIHIYIYIIRTLGGCLMPHVFIRFSKLSTFPFIDIMTAIKNRSRRNKLQKRNINFDFRCPFACVHISCWKFQWKMTDFYRRKGIFCCYVTERNGTERN